MNLNLNETERKPPKSFALKCPLSGLFPVIAALCAGASFGAQGLLVNHTNPNQWMRFDWT